MTSVPHPTNEPVRAYAPGSAERRELKSALAALRSGPTEVPLFIGGQESRTGAPAKIAEPHDHSRTLGTAAQASAADVKAAIEAAARAAPAWAATPFEERAGVFLRAAELLAGPWRPKLNAATMLGQSKTAFQAEIDAACELIDFFRFNVEFARQIEAIQPGSAPGMWNRCEYRNLEGFVLAVTPFNFTSIAGNLPTAPALMGNVVLWKPTGTALLSGWIIMDLLRAAGLPDGVINFLPGKGSTIGEVALNHPDLAGIHFTGSTEVFRGMWKTVGDNVGRYKSFPRLVGETGGKDFVFAHPSADNAALAVALVRGAFEYQGQKCSAASRAYVPRSLWPDLRDRLVDTLAQITVGDPTDFSHFMGAVIDKSSFETCQRYIDQARADADCTIVAGGECDGRSGWFVQPTVIETRQPRYASMCEEIFGPILTLWVYDDARLDEALALCDSTSPYALTGAVFARDRAAIGAMSARLRQSAGNFYVNDKPTGAVVGQQPFGGARASGTNDKAGSLLNLVRWTSVRTIKETFVPPTDWRYPHMSEP
ncbi:MAG TPA: L-glutamate gamma-semialdehyde dehydrogenase [Planctomycetota bacterium]|nr:L-glutamate gamma-semialdehyde dehydrogenase [Planctomycetota bacterium]